MQYFPIRPGTRDLLPYSIISDRGIQWSTGGQAGDRVPNNLPKDCARWTAAAGALKKALSVFDRNDLPDYHSFDHNDCPYCKDGRKLDALVNSHGYSKL